MALFSNVTRRIKNFTDPNRWKASAYNQHFDLQSPEEKELMINALYVSPHVMVMGIVAVIFSTIVCFIQSSDIAYLGFALAFFANGIIRIIQMREYRSNLNSRSFTEWKSIIIRSGVIFGSLLGIFSAYATFSHDHFNELIAYCMMLGVLATIPNRSFSSRRLVKYQIAAISIPVVSSLLMQSDWRYWSLAMLCMPMFISIFQLSNKSRETLLQVVQSGAEIKKLLVQFDTATNFMQHGFIIIDKDNTILIANSRALLLLGVENSKTWIGKNYNELLSHSQKLNKLTPLAVEKLAYKSLDTNVTIGTDKTVAETSDGDFIESSASFRDGQLVILLEDVSDRIRSAERIKYMATHDSLTGLCNREHFHTLFNQYLTQNNDGLCLLAVVDLDDFKHVNDTYGHAAGDELLRLAASSIKNTCGEYAIVSRFGGDEFVIFAPKVSDHAEAEIFINRLTEGLTSKTQPSSGKTAPKASIGLVVQTHEKATSDGMFAEADLALYESKAKSRGGWTLYSEALDANYRQRQKLKDDLSAAIDNDDITVAFQPIVNLAKGRVNTFEALSRWEHPEHGNISPALFITLAEELGIIGKITSVVLRKSIKACVDWPEDVGISVNLSAIDFENPNLIEEIDNLLWDAKLSPNRLEVEITEGTFIENKSGVADAVRELQKMGVRIALDDFGTGYSNFSYLQEVSIDKLKIDRCFVKDILVNPRSELLLKGISDIAKRLNMAVTVEGIESVEQLQAVKEISNIDNVQGWVFSKAVDQSGALELANQTFDTYITEKEARELLISELKRSA